MIWFLLGLIGITYLINQLTLKYGFRDLIYDMEINKKMAEIGEEIEIHSIIENRKILSISFIKIYERFPKGLSREKNIYNLFVLPYEKVKRTYKIYGEERGSYYIKNSTLSLGDFIGFKMIHKEVDISKNIIILPRKAELKDSIVPLGSLNGDTSVRRWIVDDPLMTIGIREYTGNEPERHIHWPSSLRYGELMVRNFDFTTDNSVIIILNLESVKPFWSGIKKEPIEKAISLTRSVMEELQDANIPYGFATNSYSTKDKGSQFYHPGLGSDQLNYFLKILGSINYGIAMSFEEHLQAISRQRVNYTTFVIITPKIFESYIEPLDNLSITATRTIVISVEEENLNKLNKNIIKYRGA